MIIREMTHADLAPVRDVERRARGPLSFRRRF